jgi:hypothetical protein
MELSDTELIILLIAIAGCLFFINKKILQPPSPKPRQNFFCGIKPLPNGYSRYGNRYECLKRGFGGGLHKVMRNNPYRSILSCLLIFVLVFLIIRRFQTH